jgi:radical S-adenosyl methionine domain-containing protein 2
MPTNSIPAVNFHITKVCNARCRFCFSGFGTVHGQVTADNAQMIISALADAGCEKINFAGGEPTLHPALGQFLRHSKNLGLVTGIVTNGHLLTELLDCSAEWLDWVGLSVDSRDEGVQYALGRGLGDHVARAMVNAERCRAVRVRVKLNTVVTALNWREDLTELVRAICPERWKAFQVLPVGGQNDGRVDDLLVTSEQYASFVARHAHLADEGLAPVVEDNDAMRGSYLMVDPLGRFFGNATGRHVYSSPILEVGVQAAMAEVGFEEAKFTARGGRYQW